MNAPDSQQLISVPAVKIQSRRVLGAPEPALSEAEGFAKLTWGSLINEK
jgi:hypothetical protein